MAVNLIKQNKWVRRLVWAVGGVGLLWGAGWLLVPPLLKSQLEKIASQELGRKVTVGRVDFTPWTLELTLDDLAVAMAEGGGAPPQPQRQPQSQPQLQIKRVYIDAALQSLVRLAPVVDAVAIDGVHLRLTHLGDGKYDIDDVVARLTRPPEKPVDKDAAPARFALFNLALSGGAVDFADKTVGKTHELRDLNLRVPFLSNLDDRRDVKTEPRLAFKLNGSQFESSAQAVPFAVNRKTDASMRLAGLDLKPYLGYIPASVPVRLLSAVLDADIKLDFEQVTRPTVKLSGVVDVKGVKVADALNQDLLAFDALKVTLSDLRPLEQVVKIAAVELTGPSLDVTRDKAGAINLMLLASTQVPPGTASAGAALTPSSASAPTSTGTSSASKKIAAQAMSTGAGSTSDAKGPVWKMEIAKVLLRGGAVAWRDDTTAPQTRLALKDVSLDASAIALPFAQPMQFNGSALLNGGGSLKFDGSATDQAANVTALLGEVPLGAAAPYLADVLVPALSGSLGAELSVNWTPADLKLGAKRLTLASLVLGAAPLPAGKGASTAKPPGAANALASIQKLEVTDGLVDLTQQSVSVGKLAVTQPAIAVERDADMHWMYERWFKSADTSKTAQTPIPRQREPGLPRYARNDEVGASVASIAPAPKPWRVQVGEVLLEGGALKFLDRAPAKPVLLEVSSLKLQVKGITQDLSKPFGLTVAARLKSGDGEPGQLDYRGTLAPDPLVAQGSVVLTQIPVQAFEPYFADALNIELLRADAGFKGDVRFASGAAGPSIKLSGDAVLDEFRANSVALSGAARPPASVGEVPAGDLKISEELLSWKTLNVRGLALAMAPGTATTVAVRETALADFFARVLINETGRINLQDVMKNAGAAGGDAAGASKADPGKSPPLKSGATSDATTSVASQAVPTGAAGQNSASTGPDAVINIGPISLINGKVFFSDHFVRPNYTANLSELTGKLSAFSSVATATATATAAAPAPAAGGSAPGQAQGQMAFQMADLELRGRAEGTASLEILGKLNPLATPLALDIKGKVRDLELPPLSPYSVKYAGHGIERGKLSVDVAYVVLPDGQLSASNNIILNQLTFGDKVEGAPNSLPVKLAVALLADRNGVIDINLPVSGSLNDPQFRLGPLIFKVIVNLIVKAITSPFSLLASAVGGGGDELSMVAFAPGTAVLGPDAKLGLDKVAKALTDRPALKMTVVGTASLDVEREAYKRERLQALLQAEKRRAALAGGASLPAVAASAAAGAVQLAAITEAEMPALLREVYKRADMAKPRNLIGMAKEIPVVEMEALLLANIAANDEVMRELALQRGVAVKDYLASRQLPVERLFLGAVKRVPPDAKWTPRAELNLMTN